MAGLTVLRQEDLVKTSEIKCGEAELKDKNDVKDRQHGEGLCCVVRVSTELETHHFPKKKTKTGLRQFQPPGR